MDKFEEISQLSQHSGASLTRMQRYHIRRISRNKMQKQNTSFNRSEGSNLSRGRRNSRSRSQKSTKRIKIHKNLKYNLNEKTDTYSEAKNSNNGGNKDYFSVGLQKQSSMATSKNN